MNKRHYEHTLPNIRGSLSNTYIANNANTVIIIGGELKPGIRTPEVNAFKLTRHP